MYSHNSQNLKGLWENLSDSVRSDKNVQFTFALSFVRLADIESAKVIAPDLFEADDSGLISSSRSFFLARLIAGLYTRHLKLFYLPLAWIIGFFGRSYSDGQLFINMYYKVWSSNSLGLQYILILFCRELLRKKSRDSSRIISFFGYMSALNSILDPGIKILEGGLNDFSGATELPGEFWTQELSLLLAMLYFYNLEYDKAEQLHAEISEKSVGGHGFLLVQTMNLGSWLRLAAVTKKQSDFENISHRLRTILRSDYDKRFALRTHSYRALIAAKEEKYEECLSELALANSIADKNPWGLEYCNHLGVTARIYLHKKMARESLLTAMKYTESFGTANFYTSFVWEANLLLLKCIIINYLVVPPHRQDYHLLADLEGKIRKRIKNVRSGSKIWAALYDDLLAVLAKAKARRTVTLDFMTQMAIGYQGQFDEMIDCLNDKHDVYADNEHFVAATEQSTRAFRFNREILNYLTRIRQTTISQLTGNELAALSQDVMPSIFGRELILIKKYLGPQGVIRNLCEGVVESTTDGDYSVFISLIPDLIPDLDVEITGYQESLGFRKDQMAMLILWKEITEQVLRDKIQHGRELESKRNEAIARTTQILAHDVRKPFSLLESILSMMNQSISPELLVRFQKEVRIALGSVNGMIADILEISTPRKVEAYEEASLNAALNSALLQNTALICKSTIEFRYQLNQQFLLNINVSRLVRVLTNIISNALQAMKGHGTVTFRAVNDDRFTEIVIHNTGSYIPESHQSLIFDSFYTEGKKDGTGLGLAIVQKVITDCGGEVSCSSSQSEGTSFTVRIPHDSARPETPVMLLERSSEFLQFYVSDADAEVEKYMQRLSAFERYGASGSTQLKILAVDDEELYLSGLSSHLDRLKSLPLQFVMSKAHTSDAALELIGATKFDLVILDVDLNGSTLNGFDLSAQIKILAPDTLVCMHSNRGGVSFHQQAQEAGADLFLPKPMHQTHLYQILESIVSKEE